MNSVQKIGNYIIKRIIDNMDEETPINFNYPETKWEVKKWKQSIQNINIALEYNVYSYKKFVGENLTDYQCMFLKKNARYSGLQFMPDKIYYIGKRLDKLKLHLEKIYQLLPYQRNTIFYNQTAESATKSARTYQ